MMNPIEMNNVARSLEDLYNDYDYRCNVNKGEILTAMTVLYRLMDKTSFSNFRVGPFGPCEYAKFTDSIEALKDMTYHTHILLDLRPDILYQVIRYLELIRDRLGKYLE